MNWKDFYDPESGISFYMVGVGSEPFPNITDVANLTKIRRQTHETCFTLKPGFYLEHGATYYTIVWAYNGAARQQNISQISDGGMLKCTILSAFINPII